jgi:glutathione S-transferase
VALVLYDHPVSSNALKVRFLLAELGLDYERVVIPFDHPRPPALAEGHPFATIPLLQDAELRLGESHTILRYLAAREGRDDLYPIGLADRARVDWALDTIATQWYPAIVALWMEALYYRDMETGGAELDGADAEAVAARVPRAAAVLELLEQFVADNGTVTGSFTIADCALGPSLWRTQRLPLSFAALPRLERIREAVSTRSSFLAAGAVS